MDIIYDCSQKMSSSRAMVDTRMDSCTVFNVSLQDIVKCFSKSIIFEAANHQPDAINCLFVSDT